MRSWRRSSAIPTSTSRSTRRVLHVTATAASPDENSGPFLARSPKRRSIADVRESASSTRMMQSLLTLLASLTS